MIILHSKSMRLIIRGNYTQLVGNSSPVEFKNAFKERRLEIFLQQEKSVSV